MQRRFATLDVFTDRRFAGNPLAVVLDAGGLDTAAMQAIAREFNHPETVFVLPPEDTPPSRAAAHLHAGARTAVRRASDRRDGGAARAAGSAARPAARSCWRRRSGRCAACSKPASGERGRVRFAIPQLPAEVGAVPDDAAIAAALASRPRGHRLRPPPPVALVGRQCLHVRAGRRACRDGACAARSGDFRRGVRRRWSGRGRISLLRRERRARP